MVYFQFKACILTLLLGYFTISDTKEQSYNDEWILVLNDNVIHPQRREHFFSQLQPSGVILKRSITINHVSIHILRGDELEIMTTADKVDVNYEILTRNYLVVMGPGSVKVSNLEDNLRKVVNKNRNKKRLSYTEDTTFCRTEPASPDVGFENGHFSWGIDRIDQRDQPLNRQQCAHSGHSSVMGNDTIVDVYIMDTGVTNHSTFVRPVQYDFTYYNDGLEDCNGHGTHVGGLVASTIYGASPWNVQIHSIRILDCFGRGDFGGIISGLLWIKFNKSPTRRSVINLSLGSVGGVSDAITNIINDLFYDGVTIFASMGNNGGSKCNVFPANIPVVIAVGATNILDERAGFSNQGPCLDVFAPGATIVSLSNNVNETGRILSGTSMSAPIAVGAFADWLYRYDILVDIDIIRNEFINNFSNHRIDTDTLDGETKNKLVYIGESRDSHWTSSTTHDYNPHLFTTLKNVLLFLHVMIIIII